MKRSNVANGEDVQYTKDPKAKLEKNFIEEYLREKGSCLKDLQKLPEEEAKQLMKEACSYASLKLADIEARAGFRQKIRGPF